MYNNNSNINITILYLYYNNNNSNINKNTKKKMKINNLSKAKVAIIHPKKKDKRHSKIPIIIIFMVAVIPTILIIWILKIIYEIY